jgi:alkaline phosphatase
MTPLAVAKDGKPKYIFYFIGDGMGLAQVTGAEVLLNSSLPQEKISLDKKLSLTQFPIAVPTRTLSNDSFITDSAAAGTALATGRKTNNGMIAVSPDNSQSYDSIAKKALQTGRKIGIVSSVSLDHATPSVFYAHQGSRSSYYDIARQMATSGFHYFGGGGLEGNMKRKPQEADLFETLRKSGYHIARGRKEIAAAPRVKNSKIYALDDKLEDGQAIPFSLDQKQGNQGMTLAEFTQKGIELLKNDKGFFMMVESGQIDWLCHANDGGAALQEVIAFDEAIQSALKFYRNHPNDTLIVVAADHETGGMTIGQASTGYATYFYRLGKQKVSNARFTDLLQKKIAERKTKTTVSDVMPLVTELLGLTDLDTETVTRLKQKAESKDPKAMEDLAMNITMEEKEQMILALKETLTPPQEDDPAAARNLKLYGSGDPFTVTVFRILNARAGIGWTSNAHTGVPTITYAIGKGSEQFNKGILDNTQVADKLSKLIEK